MQLGRRGLLSTFTGGSPAHPALLSTLRRTLGFSHRLTVLGTHPNSGRATVTVVLGTVLAVLRGEPVLAVEGAEDGEQITAITEPYSPFVLTDRLITWLGGMTDAVLELTDQLVVCGTTGRESAGEARRLLDAVRDTRRADLADTALVVLNEIDDSDRSLSGPATDSLFPGLRHSPVRIPFDAHLAKHRQIRIGRMRAQTTAAYVDLAQGVADAAPWAD